MRLKHHNLKCSGDPMKIYLCVPYTGMEELSFKMANEVAGKLMNDGHIVFSPISMSHPIAKQCGLPADWDYWKENDECFITWCDELHVACIPGWKESKGVQAEIQMAIEQGKRVVGLDVSPKEDAK